ERGQPDRLARHPGLGEVEELDAEEVAHGPGDGGCRRAGDRRLDLARRSLLRPLARRAPVHKSHRRPQPAALSRPLDGRERPAVELRLEHRLVGQEVLLVHLRAAGHKPGRAELPAGAVRVVAGREAQAVAPRAGPRRTGCAEAARELAELAPVRATLVLLESGPRLAALLADAAAILGEREVVIARELTKLHEELRRGRLGELAAAIAAEPPPRGEIVVLIGPPEARAADLAPEAVDAALREAAARLPPGRAARQVAAATGRPAAELYRRLRELGHGEDER
ncbi:MAG: hypothetical protein K6T74_17555, partial [Geminicoccaceae bacterium]|nr:hypothetical protein [Geminicoccaceae bacterium]